MNSRLKGTVLVLCALLMVACENKSTTNKTPVPTPADSADPQRVVDPTSAQDPRLPDLSQAAVLVLADQVNYSALYDISQNDFFPVSNTGSQTVGDVKIQMSIDNNTTVTGSVLIAFEDYKGFWGTQLNTFPGAAKRVGANLDLIFANNVFVVRAVGNVSNDIFTGTTYYRMRKPANPSNLNDPENSCKKLTVTCNYYGCYYPPVDSVTPCVNYMNPNQTSVVKVLGTFQATYSNWIKK